jgi:hypothetical protein
MKSNKKLALEKAVKAIYFNDNSDYEGYLWEIVRLLGGEKAVDLLKKDERKAYKKYCDVKDSIFDDEEIQRVEKESINVEIDKIKL